MYIYIYIVNGCYPGIYGRYPGVHLVTSRGLSSGTERLLPQSPGPSESSRSPHFAQLVGGVSVCTIPCTHCQESFA